MNRRDKIRATWRKRILERDGACRTNCLDIPFDDDQLHMAHITPVEEFVARLGEDGIVQSFRSDNLVILCEICHAVQTDADALNAGKKSMLDPIYGLGKLSAEFLDSTKINGLSFRFSRNDLWYQKRRLRISKVFEKIIIERGWRSVDELVLLDEIE